MADGIPRALAGIHPDDPHASEHALLVRVRADDRRAFALLVERHLDAATRFACHILRSADTAEDVVQVVFVQLWEQRATLDPARPLAPYLFRAIRNRALNERKAISIRDRYRERAQAEAAAGSVPSVVPSFENPVLAAATVQTALRQIPERRRVAVRLRFGERLTYGEIGQVLEISAEAAEKLVMRALRDLRAILDVSA